MFESTLNVIKPKPLLMTYEGIAFVIADQRLENKYLKICFYICVNTHPPSYPPPTPERKVITAEHRVVTEWLTVTSF